MAEDESDNRCCMHCNQFRGESNKVKDHESSCEWKKLQELAEKSLGLEEQKLKKSPVIDLLLLLLLEKQKLKKDIENNKLVVEKENQVRFNTYSDEPQPEASTSSCSKTRPRKGAKKQSDTFVADEESNEKKQSNNNSKKDKKKKSKKKKN